MSFLDGVFDDDDMPAEERVRLGITLDLQFRRTDGRLAVRFAGYHYKGSVDLLLQHGCFYQGRELPATFAHLRGPFNRCYGNALAAAETDPRLRYCEGVYTTGFGHPASHAWCVGPDGGVVELTLGTTPDDLVVMRSEETHMPFMHPRHWAYYGAIFDVAFVRAHLDAGGLPLFDRSAAELDRSGRSGVGERFTTERADFPVLRVPYDPDRKDLP